MCELRPVGADDPADGELVLDRLGVQDHRVVADVLDVVYGVEENQHLQLDRQRDPGQAVLHAVRTLDGIRTSRQSRRGRSVRRVGNKQGAVLGAGLLRVGGWQTAIALDLRV